MISAALVPFDARSNPLTLDRIEEHLRESVPFPCVPTEWVGYGATIPQLRVETPVALTIQIDEDPDYVPEELRELADEAESEDSLPADLIEFLRSATARLDIQSADYTGNQEVAADGGFVVYARSDLDPLVPEVEDVLLALSQLSGGPVLDCLNDRWILAESEQP
jgi:hypothetical protein